MSFATVAAGVLALVGVAGMFTGSISRQAPWRAQSFKIGSYALTVAGLVLMLSSLVGWSGTSEMFGGFLMIVLGTGASLAPAKKNGAPDESAR